MKQTVLFIIFIGTLIFFSFNTFAQVKQELKILEEYGLLINSQVINTEDIEGTYIDLIKRLKPFSKQGNIFLDLFNTLKRFSQYKGFNWQRKDLHMLSWAIKELNYKLYNNKNNKSFQFEHHFETGFELEVIHNHGDEKPGTYLYQSPFKHDLDDDGQIDLFEQDEYMRQYLNVQTVVSGPQMDGVLNLNLGLNYFGTGYLQNGNQFEYQYDLILPQVKDFAFNLYGQHFSATVGSNQILGFRDYIYYDDPTNSNDFNLTGITLQAPFGIFFGLGQETWTTSAIYSTPHDIRWIAVGTEGLGFLPINLYLTEQEIQNPKFKKVGRNVVFALTTDLKHPGYYLTGDLAFNDSADGYYGQLTLGADIKSLNLCGKVELAEHFTPIQPKKDFINTVYTRRFYDGKTMEFPARTQKGFEFTANYDLRSDINLYGSIENYLKSRVIEAGFNIQPAQQLVFNTTGKYNYETEGKFSFEIEAFYKHKYGTLSCKKMFKNTEDIQLVLEPFYENDQITMRGLLGYSVKPKTGLRNNQFGLEITYHPVKEFTFHAKYAVEDMMYGVDLPGINFTRFGGIEYHLNDLVSACVNFKNIDFRNPGYGYLVEYTKGMIKVKF